MGKLDIYSIEGWKKPTKNLCNNFQVLSFHHIYRDFNKKDLLNFLAMIGLSVILYMLFCIFDKLSDS